MCPSGVSRSWHSGWTHIKSCTTHFPCGHSFEWPQTPIILYPNTSYTLKSESKELSGGRCLAGTGHPTLQCSSPKPAQKTFSPHHFHVRPGSGFCPCTWKNDSGFSLDPSSNGGTFFYVSFMVTFLYCWTYTCTWGRKIVHTHTHTQGTTHTHNTHWRKGKLEQLTTNQQANRRHDDDWLTDNPTMTYYDNLQRPLTTDYWLLTTMMTDQLMILTTNNDYWHTNMPFGLLKRGSGGWKSFQKPQIWISEKEYWLLYGAEIRLYLGPGWDFYHRRMFPFTLHLNRGTIFHLFSWDFSIWIEHTHTATMIVTGEEVRHWRWRVELRTESGKLKLHVPGKIRLLLWVLVRFLP